MKRAEIMLIVNKILDIAEKGRGVNGFPYVSLSISNYGESIVIHVKDGGFKEETPYDGIYTFDLSDGASERQLRTCKAHLEELLQRAKGFDDACTDIFVPAVETI